MSEDLRATGFWLSFAWRSLRRGGQRSALAAGCVAFGVLSFVGLRQLTTIVTDAFLISPRIQQGADLVLDRSESIEQRHLDALLDLGITTFTPVAATRAIFLKSAGSGRTTILSGASGIDPQSFPLYGEFVLQGSAPLSQALRSIGSAVITRDLADRFDLAVGDHFFLFGAPDAAPSELSVGGVARLTPNRQSQSVYFSLATAADRGIGTATRVHVRHPDPEAVIARLEDAGWQARVVATEADGQVADLFRFMLGGAGILGLLIGGIGVANTMKVLLARRRQEIATLKAIGYRERHLLLLFGIEAAMLGLGGSLVGVFLGLALANLLMDLLSRNTTFLLSYSIDPFTVIGALLVGVATTLIFGVVAIVQASRVRPSILLRDLPPPRGPGFRQWRAGSLYALLWAMFGVLSSIVLESLFRGFAVVAFGLVGLAVLGLILGVVLIGVVRLPTKRIPFMGMAMRNLRHRPQRSIYGLVALFVGVIAIGMATVVLLNADMRFESRRLDLSGINLRVYGSTEQQSELERGLANLQVVAAHTDIHVPIRAFAAGDSLLGGLTGLVGRDPTDLRWNLTLSDSMATPSAEGAYLIEGLAKRHALRPGDEIRVEGVSGGVTVELAGIFRREGSTLDLAAPPSALIVPVSLARRVGAAPFPLQIHVAAGEKRLDEVSQTLGRSVPASVVIGKDTISETINRLFEGLFWFAVAVAGLALLAGAVLIANAVGLSMVERRQELGVLKALGYSSRQVLTTVVLENALTGAIGGSTGVLGLALAIPLINRSASGAELSLHPLQGVVLVLVATVCAALAALLVAWRPSHLRPLAVLRGD